MKIGIYNANLHTMGGGEKHIGVVAEYLSNKGHEVEFLCTLEVDKDVLSKKLNLDLSKVKIKPFKVEHDDPIFSEESKKYDLFINSTYWSRLPAYSPKNVILIFFPWITPHKYPIEFKRSIHNLLKGIYKDESKKVAFLDKLYASEIKFFKDREYITTYDLVISNSKYTKKWIKKELGVDSEILYPPIDIDEFKPGKKKDIILSVGRFFIHSHNKKQYEMIKMFKKMYDKNPLIRKYEYHLCGSVDKDELSPVYINKCRIEAKGYPVFIHENIGFKDLKELYAQAKVFWHASGLGENPNKNPDKFEHFGMTTVEAMSAGVVPVVIGYGGQLEIVKEGINGSLWTTERELMNKTISILNDEKKREEMMKQGIIDSKRYSKKEMEKSIDKIFAFII